MAQPSEKSMQELSDFRSVVNSMQCVASPQNAKTEDMSEDKENVTHGAKRTAEDMKVEAPDAEQGQAKVPRADVLHDIELTVSNAVSGVHLAKVTVSKDSSVADLKHVLKEHLATGAFVQQLLKGETILEEDANLGANGLVNGAEVGATLCTTPILFVPDTSSQECLFDSDDEGDDDDDGVPAQQISEAPEVARAVAEAMMAAYPGLEDHGGIVAGDESCRGGRVIVISNLGDADHDTKAACIKALKVPKDNQMVREALDAFDEDPDAEPVVWRCAELDSTDWSKHLESGFNRDEGDGEDDEGMVQLLAITKIMSEKLQRHFRFGFDDNVVVAPMLYGGYASDGNIVGVLSTRTWT